MKFLLIILITALFIGCADNDEETKVIQPVVYLETPSVEQNSDAIYVKFESSLNIATIHDRTVYLLDENKNIVDVDLKVLFYTNEIVLTPYIYLPVNSKYTLVVTTGVKDTNENYLQSNYEYLFTTIQTIPILSNLTTTIAEDKKYGAAIGQIDIRSTGDNNILSIDLSGNGSEVFQVSILGYLSLAKNGELDFETRTSYSLTAVATNTIGESKPITVDINVTNVAEIVPTLIESKATVLEDAKTGDGVGDVLIDNSGDHYILSMDIDGEGARNFTVSDKGKISVAQDANLDYETQTQYDLTVSATNGAGESESVALLIEIADVDSVAELDNFEGEVEENPLGGVVIGDIKIVTDGDNEISSITLSGVGDENFEVTSSGTLKVTDDAEIDYEKRHSYSLTAVAKNSAGDSESVDVLISVNNVENPFLIAKIEADDAQRDDNYGQSISVSGDYIVVGASKEDSIEDNSGAVYLYKKDSNGVLLQIAKIKADDAEEDDYFGHSVAIDGDYIVVGAYKEDTTEDNSGAVYIFKRKSDDKDDVAQIAKIQAETPQENAMFGNSVAINGNYIVVGSSFENTDTEDDAGTAYLFKRNSDSKDDVEQIATINASNAGKEDWFGHSVSIDGDYIAVGAYGEDTEGDNTGSVYLFKRASDNKDDVSQIAMLLIDNARDYDYFGYSVAISGDYILVGAYGEDTTIGGAGTAYLFKRKSDREDDVALLSTFQAKEPHYKDYFGKSVAMDGTYMVIGAYQEDVDDESDSGAAYIFRRDIEDETDVIEIEKLQARTAQEDEKFGGAVSISKDNIAIATNKQNDEVNSYIFDIEPLDKVYFYNSNRATYDEKMAGTSVEDFDAQSPNSEQIDFSLEGTDGDLFNFKDKSLHFNKIPDYEEPEDAGRDNSYKMSVIAKDSDDKEGSMEIELLVKNRYFLHASKVQAQNSDADDAFARSISISGDYVAIGVPFDDSAAEGAGAAYLFKKDSDGVLQQITKFTSDDTQEGDYFGSSISISGDYIVVGAYNEDTTAQDAGTAYLFKRKSDEKDDVRQIAKIQAEDAQESDFFGYSVAIDGNYIAVGAYQEDSEGEDAGSAYLFRRESDDNNDVVQVAKLNADNAKENDYFGYSVAISGNYIAISAYKHEENNEKDSGMAYLFKRNTDNKDDTDQIAKFQSDDIDDYDYFGKSIAIDGNYIVVGAYSEDVDGSNNTGSAYLFKRKSDRDDDVDQIAKIEANDPKEEDWFGWSVDISGDFITIGSHKNDIDSQDAGAVYIFERESDNRDDVTQVDKIEAYDGEKEDYFGYALAIDGDKVAVGAFREDTTQENTGSAYLFIKDDNED
ncbi:MAG: Ig-like domain-containing protein [Campylobacterota bacterium]|nr:Ig-like domain-containing protein [Campylobacterota bacterium]